MPIGDSFRSYDNGGTRKNSVDSLVSEKGKQVQEESSSNHGGTGVGSKGRESTGRGLDYKKSRGFWPGIWRHFKRYWLCYGILGFVFLAVFLPVFFLVIFPAIAQRLVNDASIPIYSVEVLDPTLDGITFSLSASLDVPLGLTVNIDPFNLSLFNRDVQPMQPYLTIPLSGFHLKGKSNITITNQTTKILDEDQFTQFLSEAVYSKTFTLSAFGSTTARLGKLKAPLKLNKDVELNGLDLLSGFSIDSASLALPPKEDGSNLIGSATLPNYSLVTFGLGNVTLNLKEGDMLLGNGTIQNVFLRPGNNTVPLRGNLDLNYIIQNVGKLLSAESGALTHGNLSLSASGNSTIYNGQHIPYFEKVLNNLTISTEVPILQVLFGTITGLISSNSGIIQNITSILRETDLSYN